MPPLNETNENELAILYLPLIDTHILHLKLKYNNNGRNIDWDDVYSFLQFGLLKALRSYDKEKKASMKSWIITYLRGYSKNYFRDWGSFYSQTEQFDFTKKHQIEKISYELFTDIEEGK